MKVCLLAAGLMIGLALSLSMLRLWSGWVIVREKNVVLASRIAWFDHQILFRLGTLQMQSGNCREAERNFERTLDLHPHYWAAKNNLAICAAVMGQPAQAEELFKEILSEWPDHKEARINLVELEKRRR